MLHNLKHTTSLVESDKEQSDDVSSSNPLQQALQYPSLSPVTYRQRSKKAAVTKPHHLEPEGDYAEEHAEERPKALHKRNLKTTQSLLVLVILSVTILGTIAAQYHVSSSFLMASQVERSIIDVPISGMAKETTHNNTSLLRSKSIPKTIQVKEKNLSKSKKEAKKETKIKEKNKQKQLDVLPNLEGDFRSQLEQEEEEAKLKAEAETIIAKAQEEARVEAEKEARVKAEKAASLKAQDEAKIQAETKIDGLPNLEEHVSPQVKEEDRLKAEAENVRAQAQEEPRFEAEKEVDRLKTDETTRLKAQEEAKKKAEKEARFKAEEAEARLKAQEQVARFKKTKEEAKKKTEEAARLKAAEEAKRKAENEARLEAGDDVKSTAGNEALLKVKEAANVKTEEEGGDGEIQEKLRGKTQAENPKVEHSQ